MGTNPSKEVEVDVGPESTILNEETLRSKFKGKNGSTYEEDFLSSILRHNEPKITNFILQLSDQMRLTTEEVNKFKMMIDTEPHSDLIDSIPSCGGEVYKNSCLGIFGWWNDEDPDPKNKSFVFYKLPDLNERVHRFYQKIDSFDLESLQKEFSREIIEAKEFESRLNLDLEQTKSKYNDKINELKKQGDNDNISIFSYEDDSYYRGEIKNGLRNGFGEEINLKGNYYYAGIWKNGKRTGNCLILKKREDGVNVYFSKNKTITGLFKMTGEGTYIWPNQEKYVGNWKEGMRNEKGKKYYLNGVLEYDGEWENDKKEGKGKVYREKDGSLSYDGYWINGERNGWGTYYRESGKKKYEGQWEDDTITGEGTYFRQDGESLKYFGRLKKGLRDGEGISYYENGKKNYEGEWKNDMKEGWGTSYGRNGVSIIYEGEWMNGDPTHEQ